MPGHRRSSDSAEIAELLEGIKLDRKQRQIVKMNEAILNHSDEPRKEPLPIPDSLKWDSKEPLLLPPHESRDGRPMTCANAQNRAGLWAGDVDLDDIVNPYTSFLNRIAQLCWRSEMRRCTNADCEKNRRLIRQAAPRCEWDCFRKWAVMVMSCQVSMTPKQQVTRAHTHILTAVNLFQDMLTEYAPLGKSKQIDDVLFGEGRRRKQIELMGVFDIIYWMQTIQNYIGVGLIPEGKWGPEFLPKEVVRRACKKALETAEEMGICRNRIWSLRTVAEREDADLPAFMESVKEDCLRLRHKPHIGSDGKVVRHKNCGKDTCSLNKLRDPETGEPPEIPQAHKGPSHPHCKPATFSQQTVESAFMKRNAKTVWSLDGKRVVDPEKRYVAISHVWADGTGDGVDPEKGVVNSCLSRYFISLAEELDCVGIWWDTISLVEADHLKQKALSVMQSNYSKAAYTIVHDKYLLDFEWRDSGSACIALVLSPWFSRAWTAVELYYSRCVKVLYKGDDPERPDEPEMLDLDEILAKDPARATRAHWIASSMIRRLRKNDKGIKSVDDVLAILKPRAVSKENDRLKCAGIIALPEKLLKGPLMEENKKRRTKEITRKILEHLGEIGHRSLLHHDHPLNKDGAFSWAPQDLFAIPYTSSGDLEESAVYERFLTVNEDGTIEGEWSYRVLTQEDSCGGLESYWEDHKADAVDAGLESWRNCLLLRERTYKRDEAVLVAAVGKEPSSGSQEGIINCRYIGPVKENSGSRLQEGGYEHTGEIRLGKDAKRRDTDARRLLKLK